MPSDFAFYLLILYLVGSISIVYILLCGETEFHRNGVVGWLHSVITYKLWAWIRRLGIRLCGRRAYSYVDTLADWFCNRRNPLMMLFYLSLVIGGAIIFVIFAFPLIPGPLISEYHKYFFVAHVLLTLWSFYYVSTKDPGRITQQNVHEFADLFPYDNLIFERKVCDTCKIVRPARAKHCAVCGHCVARFDHHCAWINTDVGLHNIREFLLFLFLTASLTTYVAYIIYNIEKGVLVANGLWDYTKDGKSLSWAYLLQVLVVYTAPVFGLGMFAVIVSIVLYAFLFYHLYLVTKNTTTNETFKWKDLHWELKLADAHKQKSPPNPREVDPKQVPAVSARDIKNIYDRGFFENFKEVLSPRSLRAEIEDFGESLTRGAAKATSSSSSSSAKTTSAAQKKKN